jgi:hypothetical protein
MINKNWLKRFYLLLAIVILESCESHFPAGQLVVKGKVVDETGNPVSGVGLYLSGINQKGITQLIPTFEANTITDKDGLFKMSKVVPRGTNWVEIRVISYEFLIDGIGVDTSIINRYIPYSVNGELIREGSHKIGSPRHGDTVDLNFVLKKK